MVRNKLTECGLPAMLLPDTATAFELDQSTGRFRVILGCETRRKPGGYTVIYAKLIEGTLELGAIRRLSGVSVKVAFAKPSITEIYLEPDGVHLTFSLVGMKKTVPLAAFTG
jgi:hypothetical protein